jgi:aspartate-semialdehyde dehydrogenase
VPIRDEVHQAVAFNVIRTSIPSSTTARQRMEDGGRTRNPRSEDQVSAACVRMPVFVGHNRRQYRVRERISAEQAQSILRGRRA